MPSAARPALPPGQTVTRSFPVLHVGDPPTFDPKSWDLRVLGLVERPLRFTWEELEALPRVLRESDFHGAAGFSRLRNRWEGILVRDLLSRARPRPEARFVRFGDGRGYDASVTLETALEDDVLLADTHDGRPLDPMHGEPLRVVVPRLFAWKSCKWVRTIELLEKDRPGYWESRGYPAGADPWKDERPPTA